MINTDKSIVNLREKLLEADKRKPKSVEDVKDSSVASSKVSAAKDKHKDIADIIQIRNENKLAVSGNIRSESDARNILTALQEKFTESGKEAINAHHKANVNTVMSFYPFE